MSMLIEWTDLELRRNSAWSDDLHEIVSIIRTLTLKGVRFRISRDWEVFLWDGHKTVAKGADEFHNYAAGFAAATHFAWAQSYE